MSFANPAPHPDGTQVFVLGGRPQGELTRYDLTSHRLEPFLGGISAEHLNFSRDLQWVVYVTFPEGILWRSRVNGTERMQLTMPPLRAILPRWSPDGTRIAFTGQLYGGNSKIYVVSPTTGHPEVVSETAADDMDPTFSPDSHSLVFTRFDLAHRSTLVSIDLASHRVAIIPGSENLFSPRLSPDGRFLLAMDSLDNHKLVLFELVKQQWSILATATDAGFGWPQWSSDAKFVYVLTAGGVHRVHIPDGKLEPVASVEVPEGLNGYAGMWQTAGPDGTPYLLRDRTVQEIYALDVDLP